MSSRSRSSTASRHRAHPSRRDGGRRRQGTTDADALAKVSVSAEIVEQTKGPKIRIHKFKSKTGYHKRQGHRQRLTRLEVTGINK